MYQNSREVSCLFLEILNIVHSTFSMAITEARRTTIRLSVLTENTLGTQIICFAQQVHYYMLSSQNHQSRTELH